MIHFERSEGKSEYGSSNRYFLKKLCALFEFKDNIYIHFKTS